MMWCDDLMLQGRDKCCGNYKFLKGLFSRMGFIQVPWRGFRLPKSCSTNTQKKLSKTSAAVRWSLRPRYMIGPTCQFFLNQNDLDSFLNYRKTILEIQIFPRNKFSSFFMLYVEIKFKKKSSNGTFGKQKWDWWNILFQYQSFWIWEL